MSHSSDDEKTLRVGVFSTMRQAETVVHALLDTGFTKEQITVICSNEAREKYFREYEHQQPGGSHTATAVALGGAIGAALGGLAAVAAAMATGGTALIFTGGAVAWAGGVVGGLVGAMMTRGVERELADYYEQAVSRGKILVAAEDHDSSRSSEHLSAAEQIFAANGAVPLSMPTS